MDATVTATAQQIDVTWPRPSSGSGVPSAAPRAILVNRFALEGLIGGAGWTP